jgi:selenocysteine-specific elongation factor
VHIIGTAGHVDHGKSSLVAALTGTNPDRWIEEQLRGMTLDLGFARLAFDDGTEAGIIDVPGHERFLHNMLAGAAGMELLLLVIAANEGIMPQTREHLEILQYLNVRRVVVALTKSDLLAPGEAAATCARIHAGLRGTIAQEAPIFAVSTVTGENLGALKAGLQAELAQLDARAPDAPAYLPVDRAFTLAGRGTIVTGTLMQGRIAVGDSVKIEPLGRGARVRSLHVFGEARDSASGGARVALNLPGIGVDEIARGAVVADPQFAARASFNVEFVPLPGALPLLRRRTPVRAHVGSAEILGTLVLETAPADVSAVRGELFLREPVVAFTGVRYVLRRVSPKTLLGGGTIVGLGGSVADENARGAVEAPIRAVLAQAGIAGATAAEVASAANAREESVQQVLGQLVAGGDALRLAKPDAFIDAAVARALLDRVIGELRALHEREPWALGATSLALARSLGADEAALVRVLAAFADEGALAHRSGYYHTTDHQPKLTAAQRAFFDASVPVDPEQPFVPAVFAEALAAMKASGVEGVARALDTLIARGVLVRVGEFLYRGTQIAEIHTRIEAFIGKNERMTMAEFRDIIGTSRKYAVPLLEWFDGRGITVRSGDYRMLRKRASSEIS